MRRKNLTCPTLHCLPHLFSLAPPGRGDRSALSVLPQAKNNSSPYFPPGFFKVRRKDLTCPTLHCLPHLFSLTPPGRGNRSALSVLPQAENNSSPYFPPGFFKVRRKNLTCPTLHCLPHLFSLAPPGRGDRSALSVLPQAKNNSSPYFPPGFFKVRRKDLTCPTLHCLPHSETTPHSFFLPRPSGERAGVRGKGRTNPRFSAILPPH